MDGIVYTLKPKELLKVTKRNLKNYSNLRNIFPRLAALTLKCT